jgi:putative transposase
MDITYIPMARGFIYLAAVLDWFIRRVLAWRVSITLEADFCIEAVEVDLARHDAPEIFNTDQGSQFTSTDYIKVLAAREIKISMPLGDCTQSPRGNRWQGRLARQCFR